MEKGIDRCASLPRIENGAWNCTHGTCNLRYGSLSNVSFDEHCLKLYVIAQNNFVFPVLGVFVRSSDYDT